MTASVTAGVFRTGVLAVVTALVVCARAASGGEVPVMETAAIPPGQEALFAAMLGRGADLPDGCRFADGEIERTFVRGTYDCSGAASVIELRHTTDAPAAATRTEKIALVVIEGAPPAGLVTALGKLVREREGAFEWLQPKNDSPSTTREPGCASLAPLPRALDPYFPGCYPLRAAVLVGAAQTAAIVLGLAFGLLLLYRTPDRHDAP